MTRPIPAIINPAILRWARETQGLPLDAAAKRLGIAIRTLSKAERTSGTLSVSQLRKVAEVYKRPEAAFYLDEVPQEATLPDFRTVQARQQHELTPEAKLAIREIQEKRRMALQLQELLKGPASQPYDNLFIVDEDAEVAGQKLRALLQVTTDAARKSGDLTQVFNYWKARVEHLNVLVFQFGGVDVEVMRGFVVAERPFPTIGINQTDYPYARIFTLAHEMCHIILNTTGICSVAYSGVSSDSLENFCDRVAGATLVPLDELRDIAAGKGLGFADFGSARTSARTLGSYFKVSQPVITRRLHASNLLNRDIYRQVISAIQAEGERAPSRGGGGGGFYSTYFSKSSHRFLALVFAGLDTNAISAYDAMKFTGLKLQTLETAKTKFQSEG